MTASPSVNGSSCFHSLDSTIFPRFVSRSQRGDLIQVDVSPRSISSIAGPGSGNREAAQKGFDSSIHSVVIQCSTKSISDGDSKTSKVESFSFEQQWICLCRVFANDCCRFRSNFASFTERSFSGSPIPSSFSASLDTKHGL